MSLQFILGRAGSGKTHACVTAVQARLRQDAVNEPKLVLLVPEQASLQMERAILGGGVGAAHRAEVLSFRRLAHRVMADAGIALREPLSESARVMVLRRLMSRFQPDLRYYRRLDRAPGFVRQLGDMVAELIDEAVTPAELTAAAAATTQEARAAKLHDLSLIYGGYIAYLAESRVDPSQVLELARVALPQCAWLHGAQLWVDGFASLSGQEEATLAALAPLCAEVRISLLLDPALLEEGSGGAASDTWREMFDQTIHTYRRLDRRLRQTGCSVEPPLCLTAPPEATARRSPALVALEQRLFSIDDASPPPESPADVELAACGSRRVEVDYAVSRLTSWVQSQGYRYRDVALIVRDLQPYHDLISAALNARDIPFFLDRRRPVAHHPLVAWLNGVTALAVSPYALDVVRALLKTGLTGLETWQADDLENVLIEHGIAGARAWHAAEWSFVGGDALFEPEDAPSRFQARRIDAIEQARAAFRSVFDPWIEFARAQRGGADAGEPGCTGPRWADAIRGLMSRARVDESLEAWAQRAEAEGRLDDAEQHRQITRDVARFLEDVETTFDDASITAQELADMLDAGLSRLTLGLAPPMLDQVLVGSIDRSRHPTIKAAVVLGFNDGRFPERIREGAILHDDDRTALIEGGLLVRPPRRRRVFEERLLAYIAVTRPTQKLLITYATQDESGREMRPSPYLDAICEALPGVLHRTVGHPAAHRESWDIQTERDLSARLALEFRNRPAIELDQAERRGQWNALYHALRSRPPSDHSRQAMAGLGDVRSAVLDETLAGRVYTQPLALSVSRLELFASCPFKQFSRYVLDLRPRREAQLEAVDAGRIHHAILEDFVRTVADAGRSLGDLSEDEIETGVEASWQRVCGRLRVEMEASHARDAYLIRRASRRIGNAMQAQSVIARGGRMKPFRTEQSFGFDDDDSLPAVELTTPKGRRMLLRGYMDRVDLAELADESLGVVIDYKEGRNKRLDLSPAFQGVSLQLLGYLLALERVGTTPAGRPIRPVGALLVGLSPHYQSVDHPDEAAEFAIPHGLDKPRGLIHAGHLDVFDEHVPAGARSQYYQFGLKKDGTLGWVDNTDSATPAAFEALLRRTERVMTELADRMVDGEIAVHPYRAGGASPCTWCRFRSVCRYEPGMAPTRMLRQMKRTEVMERAEREG